MNTSLPKEIIETIVWGTHKPEQKGGQQCGMPRLGAKLTSEEFGFTIGTDAFRSQMECRNFCITVFEIFIDELKRTRNF